jgi:hypothetical protein
MRPERKWTEDDPRFKELQLYICEKARHARFEHLFDEQLMVLRVDSSWLDDAMVGVGSRRGETS